MSNSIKPGVYRYLREPPRDMPTLIFISTLIRSDESHPVVFVSCIDLMSLAFKRLYINPHNWERI